MTPPTDDPRRPGIEADSDPSRAWLWPILALIPVAALAVALRLRMLLVGRSLWLDEAMVALNICGRSFAELTGPLDHDQAAPIGFLWIERAAVLAFGPNEVALRLFPFLASIAALVWIYRLCADNLGRWSGVVALALAGVMPGLFYYSGEVKQYSSDVAAGLLVLVLASGVLRNGWTAGRAAVFALTGMMLVWISHPAVFLLAGAGTTLILHAALARRFRVAALAAAVSSCWLASFAVEYLAFLRDLQANNFLAEFWDSAFLRFPPRSPRDLRAYPGVAFGLFEALLQNFTFDVDLSVRMSVFLAAAWLIGGVTLYRQGRRDLLALLVAPLGFALMASVLHKYPLKGRLALFTAASTLPVIAAGISGLWAAKDVTQRWVGGVLLAVALLLPTMQGAQFLFERPRLHDARAVLSRVARDWRPGDIVVADRFSNMPFFYYRDYGGVEGLRRVGLTQTSRSLNEAAELVDEIAEWKGRPRVWFLLDTALPDPTNRPMSVLKDLLDRNGQALESVSSRRYSAHLYRFDAGAGAGAGVGLDRLAGGR